MECHLLLSAYGRESHNNLAAQGDSDPNDANIAANTTIYSVTNNFGGDTTSIGYYSAFFGAWSASFQALPASTNVLDREAFAVNQSVTAIQSSGQLNAETSQMVSLVASGLTVSNWNQPNAIAKLTITTIEVSIPAGLSSALGASPSDVVNALYGFGASPSNSTLGDYSIRLLEASYSNLTSVDMGFTVSDLMHSAYQLGDSPNGNKTWNLGCAFIANATKTTFADSPLFTINNTALTNLLSQLSINSTNTEIDSAIDRIIATQPYTSYPYIPMKSLSGNFVNSNNDTMLVIFSFSSSPTENEINQFKADVNNSGLKNLGTVYVTGGSVLSKDVEKAFLPALEITIGPGIAISLLIVGLLFLAQ